MLSLRTKTPGGHDILIHQREKDVPELEPYSCYGDLVIELPSCSPNIYYRPSYEFWGESMFSSISLPCWFSPYDLTENIRNIDRALTITNPTFVIKGL